MSKPSLHMGRISVPPALIDSRQLERWSRVFHELSNFSWHEPWHFHANRSGKSPPAPACASQRLRPATPSFPWRVWHLRTSRKPTKKNAESGVVIVIVIVWRKKTRLKSMVDQWFISLQWPEIHGFSQWFIITEMAHLIMCIP